MIKILKKLDRVVDNLFVSPVSILFKLRFLPNFLRNIFIYKNKLKDKKFKIHFSDLIYTTADSVRSSGSINNHYFHQDLWAATKIYNNKIPTHVDIGSRLDGFIAHILPFCKVEYVDIRHLKTDLNNFKFVKGSILSLPYEDNSIKSLSCLHVLEHIGLGRYGDSVNPYAYIDAAAELKRVLAVSGWFYFSTPVGKEKLYFDAHRVFSPDTILKIFEGLKLLEFNLIDDKAISINHNAGFKDAYNCSYGCGLFLFTKEAL
jgi:hypothetical protein